MKSYIQPKNQDFNLENVMHISVEDAYDAISKNEIYFLDIREEDEVTCEFFEFQNVFFFPMSEIMEKLDHLPKEISIVVVCDNGIRGTKIANMLNRQGYKDIANLDGGILQWKIQGLPIIETGFKNNDHECDSSDCGCSCSGCN